MPVDLGVRGREKRQAKKYMKKYSMCNMNLSI